MRNSLGGRINHSFFLKELNKMEEEMVVFCVVSMYDETPTLEKIFSSEESAKLFAEERNAEMYRKYGEGTCWHYVMPKILEK